MAPNDSIWALVDKVDNEYINSVGTILNIVDFNKIAITSHSTRIEGSTLTISEAINLIEKGTPATGKPLIHQNMVMDHYEALEFVLEQAKKKTDVSISFIQEIASKTMRRTGKIVNSVLGNTDESRGDLRKVNVSAGGNFFVDQSKVSNLLNRLVSNLAISLAKVSSTKEIYTLAFQAHFDLVSIHPFTDGNGRTSRLIMNYIEAYHDKPLTVVHAEDKPQYIDALNASRKNESTEPIIDFLANQHVKFLSNQLTQYQKQKSLGIRPIQNETGFKKDSGYSMFF